MASVKKVTTKSVDEKGKPQVRYRVRWRDEAGKSREEWFKTKASAEAKRKEVDRDEFDGVSLDPRRGRRILNDYFEEWIERRIVKGRPLSPLTKHDYRQLWRRHVADALGRKPLRSVNVEAVNKWYDAVVAKSGQKQAAKAYRTLRAVFRTAEADELIRSCPCRIRGGGEEHHDERPLIETKLVLNLADAMVERYRATVFLAGFASLRTGESLGLRRRDVNLLHATIDVFAQSLEFGGKTVLVERTKSDAGRRTITIPRVVVEALDEHLSKFVDPAPDALLFTSPETGAPLTRGTLSEAWIAAKKATDAPEGLHMHDLRHHAATMAARTPGITTKELMARIGHSTMHAALRYQHAAAERDRAVASYLDDVIENARGAVVGLEGSR